jgi:ABC-2 type transport system ATP-binding protein
MLQLRSLKKSYGGRLALHGLDLEVQAGEVMALLGPNGAGKSTTVRCITGLTRPDSGGVEVDGIDAQAQPADARRLIGYVPEMARLHDALTPREFLLLKGRLFDMEDQAIDLATDRLLDGFGILDRAREPMTSFSKGMLQKVSIASALLTTPRLLVLDEPLSGLDVETAFTEQSSIAATSSTWSRRSPTASPYSTRVAPWPAARSTTCAVRLARRPTLTSAACFAS